MISVYVNMICLAPFGTPHPTLTGLITTLSTLSTLDRVFSLTSCHDKEGSSLDGLKQE